MKKYLQLYFNSIKQSVLHKPSALILLVFVLIIVTIVCAMPSRMLTNDIKKTNIEGGRMQAKFEIDSFLDNYMDIGNYLREYKELLKADNKSINGMFRGDFFDFSLKANGITIEQDSLGVEFVIFEDKYITKENLEKGQNVIAITDGLRREWGVDKGDIIEIFGSVFKVQSIIDESIHFIEIPYNADILKMPSLISGENEKSTPYLYTKNCKVFINNKIIKFLKNYAFSIETTDFLYLFLGVLLAIGFFVVSMLSTISVVSYWYKVNGRKYATYKTLGATPFMILSIIVVEMFLISCFAIGIGLILEHFVFMFDTSLDIVGYEWLHYLITFGGTIIAILVTTIVKVIKRARAVPIDSKAIS